MGDFYPRIPAHVILVEAGKKIKCSKNLLKKGTTMTMQECGNKAQLDPTCYDNTFSFGKKQCLCPTNLACGLVANKTVSTYENLAGLDYKQLVNRFQEADTKIRKYKAAIKADTKKTQKKAIELKGQKVKMNKIKLAKKKIDDALKS